MKVHIVKLGLVTLSIWVTMLSYSFAQENLRKVFAQPPHAALPRGYWLWNQGNFDYTRIDEELKAFKEVGLGGVDIYDFGVVDKKSIIPNGPKFLSDEQLDGITYAINRAKKHGLKIGFSVSNGWNAGGDWTPPKEMSMNMLFSKDTVKGPIGLKELDFPIVPKSFKKVYGDFPLYPPMGADNLPEFYEDVVIMAFPLNANGVIDDIKKIKVFDKKLVQGRKADIVIPEGNWVLLRAVVTPMGQLMWATGRNYKGYIMDHYSKAATYNHFTYLIDKLKSRLGDFRETALERFYLCSFESQAFVEWTPGLEEMFFKLNGYRMEPYIPVLAGVNVVSKEVSDRFIHDYRNTISEAFVNNHYRQAKKLSNDAGLLVASESGGPGLPIHWVPTEDYKALGAVDVMRGEFWNMKPFRIDRRGGDLLAVIKNIAGAAHVYGHKVVEMEAFTSQSKHWNEIPLDLKKLADYAFCNGMTRVIYHTMPHSPKEAGLPGWSYGAGTHYSPRMVWWDHSKTLNTYFSRVSALLQEGNFVADVAYYKSEDVPNFSIGYKYDRGSLNMGYDYDDLNTEVLMQTTEVRNGRIVLPSGTSYGVLVLPDSGRMNIEVLKKVGDLIHKGATVIGNKPKTVYGLYDYKKRETEMLALADKLWGKDAKAGKQVRTYGAGKLYTGYTEDEVLAKLGITPDFKYKVNQGSDLEFIHRATSSDDIYFVRNADSVDISAELSFRVSGRQPQLWNPLTGEQKLLGVYTEKNGRVTLPINLAAWESAFVIFSDERPSVKHVESVKMAGKLIFPTHEKDKKISFPFQLTTNINGGFEFIGNQASVYELAFSDNSKQKVDALKNVEQQLKGPWDLRFTHGWGFNAIQQLDTLIDLAKHPIEAIRHYSGKVTYKHTFEVSEAFITKDRIYMLDLGKVGDAAYVFLNGKKVADKIVPPYLITLPTGLLRQGKNNLVVEVANTWQNQLTLDLKKPENQRLLQSNVPIGEHMPGDGYDAPERPLIPPSGIIGPVRLLSKELVSLR